MSISPYGIHSHGVSYSRSVQVGPHGVSVTHSQTVSSDVYGGDAFCGAAAPRPRSFFGRLFQGIGNFFQNTVAGRVLGRLMNPFASPLQKLFGFGFGGGIGGLFHRLAERRALREMAAYEQGRLDQRRMDALSGMYQYAPRSITVSTTYGNHC